MGKIKNLIGLKFDRLKVIDFAYTKNGKSYWLCRCDCGTEKIIRGDCFNNKNEHHKTKSCGCLNLEAKNKTHNLTNTKLYRVWATMKDRCCNINNKNFYNYGKRGIDVCDAWKNDFKCFYDWAITNGYEEGLTLDRIDNNDSYTPNNCRFTTQYQQNRNMRSNIYLTYNNKTQCVADWSTELGININTLYSRVHKGYSIDKILSVNN